jgi:hypothetical protein
MQPVWQSFASHYRGPLKLVFVDVDVQDNNYRTYAPLWESDRTMPQVCRLDSRGRVLERCNGLLTLQQLRELSRRGGGSSSSEALPGEKPR